MPVVNFITNVQATAQAWASADSDSPHPAPKAVDGSGVSSTVHYNETLNFDGTNEPAFIMTMTFLSNAPTTKRDSFSKSIFEFVQKELGIVGTRRYILFRVLAENDIARDGITFESWKQSQMEGV